MRADEEREKRLELKMNENTERELRRGHKNRKKKVQSNEKCSEHPKLQTNLKEVT